MKRFLARIEKGRPRAAIRAKLRNLNNNSKSNKILLRSGNVLTNFSTRKRCFGATRDKFNDGNNVKSIPPPSRGHRRRRQELTNETNHLLEVLKNRPHERSMITSHYCYELLKGWADIWYWELRYCTQVQYITLVRSQTHNKTRQFQVPPGGLGSNERP